MKQATIRIPVHSMIDLITNSSTEIFVDSESSLKPAKELLAELLKMDGSEKTVDEVFTLSLEYGDESYLIELIGDQIEDYDPELAEKLGLPTDDYNKDYEIAEKWLKEIREGKNEKPKWIDELMDDQEVNVDTYLVVKSKDPFYDKFLELLKKLMYSPDYAEGYQ